MRTTTKRPPGNLIPTFIDSYEIAAKLGISRVHAWRMLSEGVFGPTTDIASPGASKAQLRVTEAQLLDWLDSRREAS